MKWFIGMRIRKGRLRGTLTHLHDRGGTITPVAGRVRWDNTAHQTDCTLADLQPEREEKA